MYAVGVVEIIAGLIVALKPRYGAYLALAAWEGRDARIAPQRPGRPLGCRRRDLRDPRASASSVPGR
jgi:hypothetical protein